MGIRILILGAQGQLGFLLGQHAKPALMDALDACVCYGRDQVDMTKPEQIVLALKDVRPDVVINAAAWTQVDQAELEPQLAHAVNAQAVGVLAEQARQQGAVLIHYSTDYVFDGQQKRPYLETDSMNPVNVYGQTKAEGERYLAQIGGNFVVFRTGWLYASKGKNFCNTILNAAQANLPLKVVNDQMGAPTPASWLAELSLMVAGVVARSRWLARHRFVPVFLSDYPLELPSGETFHATALGQVSWYDVACEVLKNAVELGLLSSMPSVQPISTKEAALKAARPAWSVLDCTHLTEVFKVRPPVWEKGIKNWALGLK